MFSVRLDTLPREVGRFVFRLLLRRLALLLPALLLVNFLGYAYAHLVLPIRAARIPYLTSLPEPGALWPS